MMGSLMREYLSSRMVIISVLPVGHVEEFVLRMQLVKKILEGQITNCVLPVVPV